MTATMDKSEEEIVAAIKFYYEHRDEGMIIPYLPDDPPQQPDLYLPGPSPKNIN